MMKRLKYIYLVALVLVCGLSGAQETNLREIKGTVVDASTGLPLAGAIVKAVDNNRYSALTDASGGYTLQVPPFTSVLEVTAPDYRKSWLGLSQESQLPPLRMYAIEFQSFQPLEENLWGNAVATGFERSSAVSVEQEIQSRLGAQVHTLLKGGTPGIGATMNVNGINSLNVTAQPLVVLDGMVLDMQYDRHMLHDGLFNNLLANLNVNDVEEVKVLKNGTALYGSKGANGVLLIQTKRCHSMATRIDATVSAGVTWEPTNYSMMDGEQYATYASELLGTTATQLSSFKFLQSNPDYYYYGKYHHNTRWADYTYREALSQNYGVSIQGGDEVASYHLSMGYTSAQSTLKSNDMDRLNIRFNTDVRLEENLKLRFDASFSNVNRDVRDDGATADYANSTVLSTGFLSLIKSPFLSPYAYAGGSISKSFYEGADDYLSEVFPNQSTSLANPLSINKYGEAKNKNYFKNNLIQISIAPQWDLSRHLTLSEQFSYMLTNVSEKYFVPMTGVPSFYVADIHAYVQNKAASLYAKENNYFSDTRLSWNPRWSRHHLSAFAGFRFIRYDYSLNQQVGYNTGNDKTPNMSSSLSYSSTDGDNDRWSSMEWLGHVAYDYCNRYYFQGILNASTSSRFGLEARDGWKMGGVRWGLFPSAQVGWVVTNEPWCSFRGLDYLRLSAGYEESGNEDIAYQAARTYFASSLYLNTISGLAEGNIGNTSIQWETTRRFNASVDVNLFQNRLNLRGSWFRSTTDNLLTLKTLSFLSGLPTNWSNDGALKNSGFDASFTARLLSRKDWKWELGASVGHYSAQITRLPDAEQAFDTELYGATIRSEVGQPIGIFYGYKTSGVYATTEQAAADAKYVLTSNGITKNYFGAGDVNFVDKDQNGQIDGNDRFVIGNPNPDFYGNLFTTVSYRQWRLEALFNYSYGNDVYNYVRSQLEGGSRFFNQTTAMMNRWVVEGQQTSVPRLSYADPMGNSRFSDRWIEDGSYLRLKSLTLSYTLPLNYTFLQGVTVWGQANNLWLLTRYLGSDPEVSLSNSVLGQGIDRGLLPQGKSFVVGFKINL